MAGSPIIEVAATAGLTVHPNILEQICLKQRRLDSPLKLCQYDLGLDSRKPVFQDF